MAAKLAGVDRALDVLEKLAETGTTGAPLRHLSAQLELDKAVVYRILFTLKLRGYAEQDPETGHYLLGSQVLTLADDFLSQDNLRIALHRAAVHASRESNELCHVGVPEGVSVRYIDKIEPDLPIQVVSHIGTRNPQAVTALGRAMLSVEVTSRPALDKALGDSATSQWDLDATWAAIDTAHHVGFAAEIEENEKGVSCVGVAVERGGVAVAAVSLTAPSLRMTVDRQNELGQLLRKLLAEELPPGLRVQSIHDPA